MFQRHLLLVPMVLALCACASTPATPATPPTTNESGYMFDYAYKPPAGVAEADALECGQRANEVAMKTNVKVSDRGAVLLGPIFAIAQITRARRKINAAYEEVMKACLREKGYEIPE